MRLLISWRLQFVINSATKLYTISVTYLVFAVNIHSMRQFQVTSFIAIFQAIVTNWELLHEIAVIVNIREGLELGGTTGCCHGNSVACSKLG